MWAEKYRGAMAQARLRVKVRRLLNGAISGERRRSPEFRATVAACSGRDQPSPEAPGGSSRGGEQLRHRWPM